MKLIKDIRLYKSNIKNIDGNSLPSDFGSRELNATVHRIVMKLREQKFSFNDFDHLYLNYTTCLPDGVIQESLRSIDYYHPWYRYYDIGVEKELYDKLSDVENMHSVLMLMEKVLIQYFTFNDEYRKVVKNAIHEAISKGEKMLIYFKEKRTAKNVAVIYLRYMDYAAYIPLLCVYDLNGNEILRKNLPSTIDLLSIGDIQFNNKQVAVKPRKNALTRNLKTISFKLNNSTFTPQNW